jgi:plastocyanin
MNKNIVKTETMAEFLARGGKVQKVATKAYKRPTAKQLGYEKEVVVVTEPDMSALPAALKIKYGVR